ncbi:MULTISPECIES: hypothetical protein [unclassified Halomonas]|uniref:hypothetical protein n=1 Tax=unclassified Halomonas TaxID=2609666 RepID=UPI000C89998E|nr:MULTISPECIES: hypothetical protein [unclassified Halomonas]MAR73477.1 hypothetical protein [Halomonas sp.]
MFDKAFEFIFQGEYVAFSIAIVLGILFNLKHILSFADIYKKRRIELLKEAVFVDSINGNLKVHFEDEIENEYFRLAHKVKMEKVVRDACIDWHVRLNRELSIAHFIRARSHLEIKNGELEVKISTFDMIGYWYNIIAGILLLLIGSLFLTMTNAIQSQSIVGIVFVIGVSLFLIFFGLFLLSQTFSVVSAKRVQKAIGLCNKSRKADA